VRGNARGAIRYEVWRIGGLGLTSGGQGGRYVAGGFCSGSRMRMWIDASKWRLRSSAALHMASSHRGKQAATRDHGEGSR
jgi:hypothetical protein